MPNPPIIRVGLAVLAAVLAVTSAAPTRAAAADRPSRADLDRRIAVAAQRLELVVEQYNDSREALADTRTRSRALALRLTPLQRDLRLRQRLIGGMAAQTYQQTRSGPTLALLTSGTPHQFVDRLLVLELLADQQQRALADLRAARARMSDARRTLALLADRQRQEQIRLAARRATIEGEIATLQKLRQVAYNGGSRYAETERPPAPPYVAGPAGRVVAFAYAQLGKPYRWGSSGPNGYDCSGLTSAAWRTAGVHLPHNSGRQYGVVASLRRDQLHPGDLVFFYGRISHVGIYIGGGRMIHAPEYGEHVRVSSIDSMPIHGYGRPR
ncbi:C40 family peptidase [Krasilnikovia cinnamomea]|uniref:C40 family peptidase n=1 Tax=Krasilnikovia cinnamomea TaxID=349313 RepID=UPI00102C771F|nr:C40 family peptidase [Krasilnikovia cinnamomea]